MKGKSLTDALMNMHLGYDKNEWENMCIEWQSEEYKEMCSKSKASHSKLDIPHNLGSTSIAVEKAKSGKTDMAFFEHIRTKKNGEALSKSIADVIATVDACTSNLPPTCTKEDRDTARNEALSKMTRERKHSGRVFGYGKGVTQKGLKLNSTNSTVNVSSMDKLVNELKVSEARIQELEQRDKIRESELQEMEDIEKIRESKFEEMIAHISFLESAVLAASGYPSNKDAYA